MFIRQQSMIYVTEASVQFLAHFLLEARYEDAWLFLKGA